MESEQIKIEDYSDIPLKEYFTRTFRGKEKQAKNGQNTYTTELIVMFEKNVIWLNFWYKL